MRIIELITSSNSLSPVDVEVLKYPNFKSSKDLFLLAKILASCSFLCARRIWSKKELLASPNPSIGVPDEKSNSSCHCPA